MAREWTTRLLLLLLMVVLLVLLLLWVSVLARKVLGVSGCLSNADVAASAAVVLRAVVVRVVLSVVSSKVSLSLFVRPASAGNSSASWVLVSAALLLALVVGLYYLLFLTLGAVGRSFGGCNACLYFLLSNIWHLCFLRTCCFLASRAGQQGTRALAVCSVEFGGFGLAAVPQQQSVPILVSCGLSRHRLLRFFSRTPHRS